MNHPNPPPRLSVLRRLRKVLGWGSVWVIVIYGGSNLCLSSSWAAGVVEEKVKTRTGLDCQIGGMSWSPWNGITISEIKLLQPEVLREHLSEPVVEVESVRVMPYWGQLIRGRIQFRDVKVTEPRVTVALEMLATIAMDTVRGQSMPPMVMAPDDPSKVPSTGGQEKTTAKNTPKAKSNEPGGSKKSESATKKSQKAATVANVKKTSQAPRPNPSPPARPAAELPLWVSILKGHLKVVSVSKGIEVLRLDGVEFGLPLLGEDTEGQMTAALFKVAGLPEIKELQERVAWKRPYLQWGNAALSVGGLEVGYRAQVGILKRPRGVQDVSFLFDVVMPSQKLERKKWLEQFAIEVEADNVSGRFRCAGVLRRPQTWMADIQCRAEMLRVEEEHGGRDVVFDEVVVPALFRQGTLRWGGVRLIGEDISVLGNGQVSLRDGILSITRLVVSPEVSQMLSRGLHGAGLLRNGPRWWDDLDTPDRKVRDLLVTGSINDPVIDAGLKHQEMSVWEMIGTTLHFVRLEMKEEGVELEMSLLEKQ